jgi:hypothetical protein
MWGRYTATNGRRDIVDDKRTDCLVVTGAA